MNNMKKKTHLSVFDLNYENTDKGKAFKGRYEAIEYGDREYNGEYRLTHLINYNIGEVEVVRGTPKPIDGAEVVNVGWLVNPL